MGKARMTYSVQFCGSEKGIKTSRGNSGVALVPYIPIHIACRIFEGYLFATGPQFFSVIET